MNGYKWSRRAVLGGIAGAATTPLISGRSTAIPGYDDERVGIESIIETSEAIAEQQTVDTGIVETADVIASVYEFSRDESEDLTNDAASVYDLEKLDPDTTVQYHHIRPALKIAFELDRKLGITVPKNKLLQAYWAGASLTSIGGVVKACRALGEASIKITEIDGNPVENLSRSHRIEFAIALLTLIAELAFIYIPINFNFAWTFTRFATNRGLYRVRHFAGNSTLAILMSAVHWLVRDAPKRFVEFIISPETFEFISTELSERAQEIDGFEAPSIMEIKNGVQKALEIAYDINLEGTDLSNIEIDELEL